MDKSCEIVRDLLPLVLDGVSSDSSREYVSEHLAKCESCRALRDRLESEEIPQLRPREGGSSLLRRISRRLLLTALLTASIVITLAANLAGAWDGGPARWYSLAATAVYIASVTAFIIATRHWSPFLKASRILSAVSLAAAIYCTVCRIAKFGYVLSAILSVAVSVPFYGLRAMLDWTGLYLAAAVISGVWLALVTHFSRASDIPPQPRT